MAENMYFPLTNIGGSGGGDAPYIEIVVTDENDISGTLTEDQLEIVNKDNSCIRLISGDGKLWYILSKIINSNQDDEKFWVFQVVASTQAIIVEVNANGEYGGGIINITPSTYVESIKVNGNYLTKDGDGATILNLKSINGNLIVGEGDITVSGGSAEVIERTINDNYLFTTDLTTEEFNKLKNNQAVLKVTGAYLDVIPIVLYLSNPVYVNGTDLTGEETIAYVINSPLESETLIIVKISNLYLGKLDVSQTITNHPPVTTYSGIPSYERISYNPLLGFVQNEADQNVLNVSRSLNVGKFTYDSSTSKYTFSSGLDTILNHFVEQLAYNLGFEAQSPHLSSFEVKIELNENNPLSSYTCKKQYSCILGVSSGTSGASEGTFTIYDTTINKVTYVLLRIYTTGGNTSTFEIDYLKAYQDGTEITSTFVSSISAIYLNLL